MKNSPALTWLAIFLAVIAVVISLRPSTPQTQDNQFHRSSLNTVLREKRLHVGYIQYPPAVFRDKDGKMRGQFVDTLNEIVKELNSNIEISYEETTWADFSDSLNSGRIDLSIAPTFATIPRAKRIAFTQPLVYLGRSAIVRRGDTRFAADKGPMQFDSSTLKVGVVDGEGSHEFVKANFKNLSNLVVFSGADLSQCLVAVSSGQVDVGMSDALETEKYAKSHSDVVDLFAEKPYDITPISWAVRHDDVIWKNFLDTAILALESQGKLDNFEKRYSYRWLQPVIEYRKR